MSLKYGILSILLFIIIFLLALKNYGIWNHTTDILSERGSAKKSDTKTESPSTIGSSKNPISIESYIFIAEKNIFSPERKEFPILATPSTMADPLKKPMARPQFILYGVMISDHYQSATIGNPGRPPLQKGEREMMTLKIGEQVGEYKLVKILSDRIVLAAPEDTIEVLLYDPKTPKKRGDIKTASKPAAITSAIASPTTGSVEVPKTTPVRETIEKPKATVQEKVTPPPPVSRPVTPASPPITPSTPLTRRSRVIPTYPTTGAPTPVTPTPVAPPQETGGI
jgi:hypothetical protein